MICLGTQGAAKHLLTSTLEMSSSMYVGSLLYLFAVTRSFILCLKLRKLNIINKGDNYDPPSENIVALCDKSLIEAVKGT